MSRGSIRPRGKAAQATAGEGILSTLQPYLEEMLAPIGGVVFRRMFGGQGLFRDGVIFAVISRDVLYFRGDEQVAPEFERAGAERWGAVMGGRVTHMPYWRAPDAVLEDPDALRSWAAAAYDAALRARAAKAEKPAKARKASQGGKKSSAAPNEPQA